VTPDKHSYSLIIKNEILARLKLVPTFASIKKFATSPMRQIQAEHIPYLGCYLLEELLEPDGDGNAGEPRFTHAVKIGFTVVIENNNPDVAEQNLDAAHWAIMNLLHDPRWHVFKMPPPFKPVRIESITKGTRKHIYGNASKDNETPVAELQMDLTYRHRTRFEPIITDTLDSIHEVVAYPWPYDPLANEPFLVVYDFETAKRATRGKRP
jgi:hypothetical protein